MVIMTAAKLPAAFAVFCSVALSQAPPPTVGPTRFFKGI